MIAKVLSNTKDKLNQHLKNSFDINDDCIIVNKIIETNGSSPEENQNKVVITLINLDSNPDLVNEDYDIKILVTSDFNDYIESLKFLDTVLQFFKANAIISDPSLPNDIANAEFVLDLMSHSDLHNIWTALGAKYKPSIVYKIKLK